MELLKEAIIMNTQKDHYVTPDEYELLQDTFDCKTEYSNGEIIVHSNTDAKHNRIILNISFFLTKYFKGSQCSFHTEQIEVIFDENHKYKPDIFIICENDKNNMKGESYTTPPKIIFEVISKSTASHDRITKLQVYRKYGVLEYNMIEQDGTMIQCILSNEDYIVKEYKMNDEYISSVLPDLKINLNDIFE